MAILAPAPHPTHPAVAARLVRASGRLLRTGSVLALVAGALLLYGFVIRPAHLRWGATDAEVAMALPGDEFVPDPTFDATRAITINAPPEAIWPWLVQWGYGRAGFYGYDLVENLGSPSGLRSADTIIPALQHLAVGDLVKMNDASVFRVRAIEPERLIVLGPPEGATGDAAMVWALAPIDAGHTRLILRLCLHYSWARLDLPVLLFTDAADPVAVHKILAGIKDRAEGRAEPFAVQAAELGVIALVVGCCLAALGGALTRRRWPRLWWVALDAEAVLLFMLYTSVDFWIKALLAGALLAALIWFFPDRRPAPA